MNIESFLVGAILIALCSLPFFLMSMHKRKRKNQKLKILTNLANQNNCKIDKFELCGNYAIGVDKTKKYVFFYKNNKEMNNTMLIDLANFKSCKIVNYGNSLKNNKSYYSFIEKLDLNFIPVSKDIDIINLEFFNSSNNTNLSGELESIEKWSLIINDLISNKN